MILLFYLIGCFVCIFVIIKYANAIEMIRYINSINEISTRIFGLCFIAFEIILYTSISWIGAIITYVIFKK
jgi:hypothetical protein